MSTRAEKFAGLSVAIITPFRNGKVDYARLREQIDFQASAGVTCICPVGTTGESPTLTHDEHERVITESVTAAGGRMLVMPGTGSNSTAEALRLTEYAARAGADAALAMAGRDTGEVRLPLMPLEKPLYDQLRCVLRDYGVPLDTPQPA